MPGSPLLHTLPIDVNTNKICKSFHPALGPVQDLNEISLNNFCATEIYQSKYHSFTVYLYVLKYSIYLSQHFTT